MDSVNCSIKTVVDQSFAQQKFNISEIRDEVRFLTGAPDLVINKFLNKVVADFCKKTWLMQKTVELGETIVEEVVEPVQTNLLSGVSGSVDSNWTQNPDGSWTSDGTQTGLASVGWETTKILDGITIIITGRVIEINAGSVFYYLESNGDPVVISTAGAFTDTQTGPYPDGQDTLVLLVTADFVGTVALDTAYDINEVI